MQSNLADGPGNLGSDLKLLTFELRWISDRPSCQQESHVILYLRVMARKLKPVRLVVLIGLAAFVVFGVAVFCTHRAAHGRTAEEWAAYEIGQKAGEQAPRDAKLPTDAELNMMAQKYFEYQAPGDQLQNPPPPGGLEARKQAFEKGYTDGFKKTHPDQ